IYGSGLCDGRVEISINDQWGTVCDDLWDINDGDVVCRQMGCGRAVSTPQSSRFGPGSGSIYLDDVVCSGSERSLTKCSHSGLGVNNCDHSKDAGVVCSGKIRLVSGSGLCDGRVEISINDQWGTVCDDLWDINDGDVVCRQMGCGQTVSAPQSSRFGPGSGSIYLDDVVCSGSERSLTKCSHRGLGVNNCDHSKDAGVVCSENIRLVNGSALCDGRVEISINDQWGTVCDDLWDINDGDVVCRQMGCGRAVSVPQSSRFGPGSGSIYLDDVVCSGSERSLTKCSHRGLGVNNCDHSKDAGVVCSGKVPFLISNAPYRRYTYMLVSGSGLCDGRVEISINDQWGTVCDDLWDINDGDVVCRQMGCGRAVSAPQGSRFGPGSGSIFLDDVVCSGSERSLTKCSHRGLGVNNCDHSKDAGVVCSDLIEGDVSSSMRICLRDTAISLSTPLHTLKCFWFSEPFCTFSHVQLENIRLVNGSGRCDGRVEISINDQWGTVCDDLWDINDGDVVCRQMGCGRAVSAPQGSRFGPGSGSIYLDDVGCSGSERSLTKCSHSGLGLNNCDHSKDAGVVCSGKVYHVLIYGSGLCDGRVEISINDQWGTVCDDLWDINDGDVVCRQMGCGRAVSAPQSSRFGPGSGSIYLDDVVCSGSERSLTKCSHRGLGVNNCDHSKDAGVVCSEKIRLVSGSGLLCDDLWDINDGDVVCRQMGCGRAVSVPQSSRFGPGSGSIYLDDVVCSGSERSLTKCSHRGLGVNNCDHSKDAGVVCSGKVPFLISNAVSPSSGLYCADSEKIRLVSGSGRCDGRVEISINDQWGTVCDDGWDINDGDVVCRQMGCGQAVSARGSAYFGQGSGPIHLDEVGCSGHESTLTNCSNKGIGVHDCDHHEDAGVVCSENIRLVKGHYRCEGRVEVYLNNQWGTVCDDGWDINDGDVVCRQVGCGRAVIARSSAYFGQGSGTIYLDDVGCSGSETTLTDCSNRGIGVHNCGHQEDAGVVCSGEKSLLEKAYTQLIRLVSGSGLCDGRVEISINDQWGTVCDDLWDINDGDVVCRQMGCGRAVSASQSSRFGPGSGTIYLDDVVCSGSERSLTKCSHRGLGVNNCTHSKDAGVVCSGKVPFLISIEAQGKTQDMLEGLCLGRPGNASGFQTSPREVWVSLLRLLPPRPNPG
uniref:Soluble scavenger receptor cysteine-rich domain-containing protein SSC5D n=1 Tax=Astyanax mexicanus TaxID=7994 RepID=A0A3B1KKB3_ASTMX